MKTSKFLTFGALGGVALYLLLRLKKNSKPLKSLTATQMPTVKTGGIKPMKPFPTKAVLVKEEKPDPKSPKIEPLDCLGKNKEWEEILKTSKFPSAQKMEFAKKRFLGSCYPSGFNPDKVVGGNGVTNGANLGNGDTNGANLGNGSSNVIIGIDKNKYNPKTGNQGSSNFNEVGLTYYGGGSTGKPIDASIMDNRYRPEGNTRFF